jgi:hypothetical protein
VTFFRVHHRAICDGIQAVFRSELNRMIKDMPLHGSPRARRQRRKAAPGHPLFGHDVTGTPANSGRDSCETAVFSLGIK